MRHRSLPEQGLDRFKVTVSTLRGETATATFRDTLAASAFVRRIAARGERDYGEMTGYRIVDTATGNVVGEGIAQ